MSTLPGFHKISGGGVTKFSELEMDKTFDESMKLLNQNKDQYQWNITSLRVQSSQELPFRLPHMGVTDLNPREISGTMQPSIEINFNEHSSSINKILNLSNVTILEDGLSVPIRVEEETDTEYLYHDDTIVVSGRYSDFVFSRNVAFNLINTSNDDVYYSNWRVEEMTSLQLSNTILGSNLSLDTTSVNLSNDITSSREIELSNDPMMESSSITIDNKTVLTEESS